MRRDRSDPWKRARPKGTEPIGSRVPGSRLLRDYCFECGAPMRVVDLLDPKAEEKSSNWCERCAPRQPPPAHFGNGDPGQIAKIRKHYW